MINLDITHVLDFIKQDKIFSMQDQISKNYQLFLNNTGEGHEFTGWVDLPDKLDEVLFARIEQVAHQISINAQIHLVIGIGGSYLGAKAVIDALDHHFPTLEKNRKNPITLFAGHQISSDYMADLLGVLDQYDYCVTVISKSGTTTEPAIAFRIIKQHLEEKYGEAEASKRIVAITDESKGALRELATKNSYETFVVPDDVGGRFSVLTPVGLLPIAAAGFNIQQFVDGARKMMVLLKASDDFDFNPANLYAATRNALYQEGKIIEVMVNYLPNLQYITEWWKQLFGESEGKDGKGLFPAGVNFTTDLHSMGQYLQDGKRHIFETTLSVAKPISKVEIPMAEHDLDQLNYLEGKTMHDVNLKAEEGTRMAHIDGGLPNIRITLPELNEYYIGQLLYFFEFACGVSAYYLGVNPFNQPGVESYKRNMFRLLGKEGY